MQVPRPEGAKGRSVTRKLIRLHDLRKAAEVVQSGRVLLLCRQCGAETSANPCDDYWYTRETYVFRCYCDRCADKAYPLSRPAKFSQKSSPKPDKP